MELKVIEKTGFISYFLIVGDDLEPLYNDPGDDFSEGSFAGVGPIARSASASSARPWPAWLQRSASAPGCN